MHAAIVENRIWTDERNLSLTKAERRRETLIYILGRVGRETLPEEVWTFLAEHTLGSRCPAGIKTPQVP